MRLDQGDAVGAEGHLDARLRDDDAILGQSSSACHVRRRFAADEGCESIAWSKWVCTGSTAASRSTPVRVSAALIRACEGISRRRVTKSDSGGREKKPSVINAVLPSSIRSVDTPSQVMFTAEC